MPSFIDIVENETLTKDDIRDVPPIPVGHYVAMVQGMYEKVESGQKKTPGLQFKLRLMSAREDVDQDVLNAYLEASRRKLMDVELNHTIWESPYALQSLRDFLYDACAINENLSVKEALAETPSQQVIVGITHRPFTDNSGNARLRAEINSIARAL